VKKSQVNCMMITKEGEQWSNDRMDEHLVDGQKPKLGSLLPWREDVARD